MNNENELERQRVAEVEARGKLNEPETSLPNAFVTVYMPIAGWKSVLLVRDSECGNEHVPEETGMFAYATKAEAVADARLWAKDLELRYIDVCPEKTEDAPSESVTEQILRVFFDTGETG